MVKKRKKKEVTLEALTRAGEFYSKKLIKNATPYELKFKKYLEKFPHKFIFQHPIICASKKLYILDFYFPELNLVIEIDSVKYHTKPEDIKKDNLRTRRLKKEGITVKRVRNTQIIHYKEEDLISLIEFLLKKC